MLPWEGEPKLEIFGVEWSEPKEKNLVWKAMEKFREAEPEFEICSWSLLKKIPSGGGLGGGSSDAAFALRLLAQKAGWEKNDPRLLQMAADLGSDCAFFLYDQPMIGRGRGEILTPFSLDLSAYRIEFVFPGIHVSTALAFSRVEPNVPEISLEEILSQPVESWKDLLKNDFETSVFQHFPELADHKKALYEKGAVYAAMSGSGSTLFGLFRKE
jgi:4-diphosphocytidyl-2-C-methyl-D-erythritol kinase